MTSLKFAQGCGDSDKKGDSVTSGGTSNQGTGGSIQVEFDGGNAGNAGLQGNGGTCGGTTVNAEPLKVNLLFVIDRSASMSGTPAGFPAAKWPTMVTSLKSSLDGIKGKMAVGLQFFPDPPSGSSDSLCGMPSGTSITIPIADSVTTVPLITQKLDESSPTGSTPTADALELAHSYFTTGAGKDLEGENYVLLALDGGPNCNESLSCGQDNATDRALCTNTYDLPDSCGASAPFNCCNAQPKGCLDSARVVSKVKQLRTAGITTIVVGIPGSEAYASVLDELAIEGGSPASQTSPKYFKVADAEALTKTLVSLSLNLVKSCDLQLETAPPNPNEVNVYLDGDVVPKLGDDGWDLDNSTTPPTVRLKGATCTKVETEGAQSIRVSFGCPTVTVK
jgi:hypothetical protein